MTPASHIARLSPVAQPAAGESKDAQAVREAAREFEAIMIRSMLKSVEKCGSLGEGVSGQSSYGWMVVEAVADAVTKAGGLGLARLVAAALPGQSARGQTLAIGGSEPEHTWPAGHGVRRLKDEELEPRIVGHAERILAKHHRDPIGTEESFEVGGRRYVGRIEHHYHPVNGAAKPWGWHKGCTVFATVPAAGRAR